jgi:hypothetical protein
MMSFERQGLLSGYLYGVIQREGVLQGQRAVSYTDRYMAKARCSRHLTRRQVFPQKHWYFFEIDVSVLTTRHFGKHHQLHSSIFLFNPFTIAYNSSTPTLFTTIPLAAPPPLHIAATPYSPTFN